MLKKIQNGLIKFLKFTLKFLFNLIKLLFCIFITIFIGYFATVIIIGKFDWQILFYEIISIFTIIGVWIITFVKVKNKTTIVFTLLFVLWLTCLNQLPSVKKQLDIDDCLDSGSCTEGLFINTEYGKIEITKENCLKYNWVWNEERKYCKLKAN